MNASKTTTMFAKYIHTNPFDQAVSVRVRVNDGRPAKLEIGEGTWLGTGVTVLGDVKIGADCQIHDGVILHACTIGDHVRIAPKAIIGEGGESFTTLADSCGIGAECEVVGHLAHNFLAGRGARIRGGYSGAVGARSHVFDASWRFDGSETPPVLRVGVGNDCWVQIRGTAAQDVKMLTIGSNTKAYLGSLSGNIVIGEECLIGCEPGVIHGYVDIHDCHIPSGAGFWTVNKVDDSVLIAVDGKTTFFSNRGTFQLFENGESVAEDPTDVPLTLLNKVFLAAYENQKKLRDAVRHAEGRYTALQFKVDTFVDTVKR